MWTTRAVMVRAHRIGTALRRDCTAAERVAARCQPEDARPYQRLVPTDAPVQLTVPPSMLLSTRTGPLSSRTPCRFRPPRRTA